LELLNPLADANFPAQTVSFTGTAGSTTGWNAGPQGVVIWATEACYVLIGENATATTSSTPIPANTPIPFTVPGGTGGLWRVSAIQISAGGTVYAKPVNIR
jgi:uncharacterized cupin superfamily protein